MSIPEASHPKWKDIVLGKSTYTFESLAVRILLGRITVAAKFDPSPEKLAKAVNELREVFVQNQKLQSIQRDLAKVFGGR